MSGTPSIPELLDQYREETGQSGKWITVQKFRTYFHLHESEGQAIAGFLRRIHHGPYAACRFRISRIEWIYDANSPHQRRGRYRVERRAEPREKHRSRKPEREARSSCDG